LNADADHPIKPADELPSQTLTTAPWGFSAVLLALGVAIGLFVVLALTALVVGVAIGLEGHPGRKLGAGLVATLLFDASLLTVALVLALTKYHLSLRNYGFRRFGWAQAFLPAAGTVGAYVILGVYIAISYIPHLGRLRPSSNLPPDALKYHELTAVTVVLACLVAPFVEESFFRGFVFRGLLSERFAHFFRVGGVASAGRFWVAAVPSGFIFAASHLQPGLLIPFTGVGILFAWLFWRSGSLWPNILAHAGFNAVSFALSIAAHH
jgi:membrane protease YdiL (CAAX protease family)